MNFVFRNKIWYWKGPAPFYFVSVPEDESDVIHDVSKSVTYGWGMIPVRVTIGDTEFTTAMYRKDGLYVVPLKDAVRKAEDLKEGDEIEVDLQVTNI